MEFLRSKKIISLFMALTIILTNIPMIASASNLDSRQSHNNEMIKPDLELVESLKLSKSSVVKNTEIQGRLIYDSEEERDISIAFTTPSLQTLELAMNIDDESGYYIFAFSPEEVGNWSISYIKIDDVFYDGSQFEQSFKVMSSIGEIYPNQENPYVDDTYLQDGMTIRQVDLNNALGQVKFYDENSNAMEVNVNMSSEDGNYEYEIYNDGISITTTPFSSEIPPVGSYEVTFAVGGKNITKNLIVVDDYSEADYVYLASIDSELMDENISLSGGSKAVRLSGANRYETAVEISKSLFKKADKAVLTNGFNYPDTLAAVSYASAIKGPVLFTSANRIDQSTIQELNRLGVKEVILIGGEDMISAKIESQLKSLNIRNSRIFGNNRFATAIEIANKLNSIKKVEKAILVSSNTFPDALTAGGYSGQMSYPIFYTDANEIGQATLDTIKELNIGELIIVGGNKSVSEKVEAQLAAQGIKSKRVSGANRYETSLNFANEFYKNPRFVALANGQNFPDALTGGTYSAVMSIPILLTSPDKLNDEIGNLIKENKMELTVILGGFKTVSEKIFDDVNDILYKNIGYIKPNVITKPGPYNSVVYHIEKRIPTPERPIKILLDQGHGWRYNKGVIDGYYEGIAMYWYGFLLKNELDKYGFDVKLTRTDIAAEEAYVRNGKFSATDGISLKERGNMGQGYDLLLSLHTNAMPWNMANYNSVRGSEVYDSVTTPRNDLAKILCATIANHFGHPNRGVRYRYNDDSSGSNWYGVLRHSKATHSMLVEHGFHTNVADCTLLMNRDFKIQMAQKVAKALADYYGMPAK